MNLIETGHHQVNADCNPDLSSHCVLAGAKECFDTQVLFDPLEEQFDLPSAFINVCDDLCRQIEVVGQEHQTLSSLGIEEADTPKLSWIVSFSFIGAQSNCLIAAKATGLIDWTGLAPTKSHISFCSNDKEGVRAFDPKESGEIQVSAIEDIDAPSFENHLIHEVDVMNRTVGNLYKHWDRASQVDLSMEFNRSFGFAKMSPRKHRQAQVNRRGIDGINHLVNIETIRVFAIKSSRFANQHLRECFVNAPVTMFVRISEIRSCDIASDSHRVEVRASSQAGFNISKTLSESNLSKSHSEKMISGSHAFTRSRHRVLGNATLKLFSVQKVDNLSEYKAASVHPLLRMKNGQLCQLAQMRDTPFSLLAA